MTAAERALLARVDELADTAGLADQVTEIIGRARAARVDQAALAGLVTAVRLLDGDATTLFRAVRGRCCAGGFGRDRELLEAVEEAGDDIADRDRAVGQLHRQAVDALQQARTDAEAAGHALVRARAMVVTDPCQGCHAERSRAIGVAQRDLDEAGERENLGDATLQVLAPLARKLPAALRAVRRVPDDLHETYEVAYDLVADDPRAMPRDGDFITGEKIAAAMAAQMLAERIRPQPAGSGARGVPALGQFIREALA